MAVIKNVSVSWVKCDQEHPDMGYDGDSPAWTVNVDNPPADIIKLWKDKGLGGLKTNKDTGKEYLVLKRKAAPFANGDQKDAPVVVDGHLKPLDPNIVGNGSIANIQYSTYPWKHRQREGIAADLMGIQVINLIAREGTTMEFEMVDQVVDDAPFDADSDDDDLY